jgi:hypothetical protein
VASRGTEHDGVVLAVGAVVLVGVLLMGAWVAHADAVSSITPPHVKVARSGTGPDGSSLAATTATTTPASVQAPASNDGDLSQTLTASVRPGFLTINPTAGSVRPWADSVTFSHDGNGHGGPYRGTLPPVRVADARGSLDGWDATVSLQGIDGLSASQLAGALLCINPRRPAIVAGNPGEVRSAKNSCGGVGEPVSVLFAPPGGGGGTFTDTASLKLRFPGGAANPVSATLVVAVH